MAGPVSWSLGGDAPEPQTYTEPDPKKVPEVNLDTHTGTDPHGRAVGPLEDHTKPKKVYDVDGNEVLPEEAQTKRTQSRRAKKESA